MPKTPPLPQPAATVARLLESVPLLSPLTQEQRRILEDAARVCVFTKGEGVFEEGQTANGFYILLHGLVKIYHITPDGKELVLRLARPGSSFGEAPVFKGGAWPASAAAITASRALFIPGPEFLSLVRQNADLGLRMLRTLAQRLYMFTRKLEAQSGRDASQRLAAYLVHRGRLEDAADFIRLETPRETLANMLGTARETLSRGLTKLADLGAIEVQGRAVRLCNMELLQNIADGLVDGEDL